MKLKQILNKEDADRIIRETPDYVHVNRSLKLYDDEGVRIFNYALRRMLKLKYFVLAPISLVQNQIPTVAPFV